MENIEIYQYPLTKLHKLLPEIVQPFCLVRWVNTVGMIISNLY